MEERAGKKIFNVHAMMLEDDDYNDSVHNIITTQNVNYSYLRYRSRQTGGLF